jgi:uncharacterized protein YqeY
LEIVERTIMLRQKIYDDLKKAMKARDVKKWETLRFVWSEIKNKEIDAKHELSDEEVISVLRTEVKRRNDAIEQFEKGKRKDLADDEKEKTAVIETYMPSMMGEEEIRKAVEKVVGRGENQFGRVMSMVMKELKGRAEGKMVKKVVDEVLAS